MSSDAFWNSSLKEVFIAIEGFREFNTTGDDTTPLSEDELKELTDFILRRLNNGNNRPISNRNKSRNRSTS